MSCGGPHEVDCAEVLAEVWLYLDAETDGPSREKIAEHLDECGPCLREFGIEQEVKALVARCCGGEVAPDSLRRRLITTIRQAVVSDDGSRAVYEETTIEVRREA
ncbi:mycothiol system anti-sigma-R factor [Cryptosporangium aurantiacum]|uniref:Mycothiol system anti-sigma-R factor n=1 Tax=Cryptosporangium aurantiacum TaxID=134849 RepID=A0A1M7QMV0_9ACTN|nr:mycothiol system anti-sigma-R factor [Cryptosporangium aurantiacum]SHN32613.1 mycothiol system anti-sigma-R factor [Cryptosporangium aurantiacum]